MSTRANGEGRVLPKEVSERDLVELAETFPSTFLLIGSGAGLQYANPAKAIDEAASLLKRIEEDKDHRDGDARCLFVFGGDTADPKNPDLGYLVQQLKRHHAEEGSAVCSVQSWPEVDTHVDFVLKYDREYVGDKEYWGGVVDGNPVAATRHYLSEDMQRLLTAVVCVGGGNIAKQELQLAIAKGIDYHYIRAEVRNKREGSNPFGPTDDFINSSM